MPLAIGNDNRAWIYGVVDTTTGQYVNNMALTGTMYDKSGNVVATGLVFNYQAGSNANYIAIIPAATPLSTSGNPYNIVAIASNYNFEHTISNLNAETG